ncbi:hypothetical protein HBB16_01965 [Pseudonocardia sp. MCCB 268]|nr:hypothetical protein [Pseudonocardia cytotoxica]
MTRSQCCRLARLPGDAPGVACAFLARCARRPIELGAALVAASWRRSPQLRASRCRRSRCRRPSCWCSDWCCRSEIAERLPAEQAQRRSCRPTPAVVLEELPGSIRPEGPRDLDAGSVYHQHPGGRPGVAGGRRVPRRADHRLRNGPEISGDVAQVTPEQRATVAEGGVSRQYTTVDGVPTLVIGQPVSTAGRELQFYSAVPGLEGERG